MALDRPPFAQKLIAHSLLALMPDVGIGDEALHVYVRKREIKLLIECLAHAS